MLLIANPVLCCMVTSCGRHLLGFLILMMTISIAASVDTWTAPSEELFVCPQDRIKPCSNAAAFFCCASSNLSNSCLCNQNTVTCNGYNLLRCPSPRSDYFGCCIGGDLPLTILYNCSLSPTKSLCLY